LEDATLFNNPTQAIPQPVIDADTERGATLPPVESTAGMQHQAGADEATAESAEFAPGIGVSLEIVLYLALAAVGLILRLAELGTLVLSELEAREALAVFRILESNPTAVTPISSKPLMFAANGLLMTLLGTENAIPRLATVFAGVAILLMPLLFRRWIGSVAALIISVLLTISPVLLTASRTMAGSVWSILLALVALWALGRYHESKARAFAYVGAASIGLLIIGAESAGFLTAIMLGAGCIFAFSTVEDPDHSVRAGILATVRGFPLIGGLVVAAVTLFLIGTVFLLKVEGAAAFGEVVSRAISGFLARDPVNPVAFPLYTSLIYEPLLWVFGLVGAWLTLREEGDFLRRLLLGWLVAAVIASLIYPAALAEHALWLTLPLVGLSAIAIERVLTPVRDQFWNVPVWGPYLHAVAVVALLLIIGMRLLVVGQSVLRTQPSLVPQADVPALLLTGLTVALVVILFFLVGSIWGSRASWRGMGIGVLMFLSIYGLASGWRASVFGADDPREPWRPSPTAQNLMRLENDLKEVSLRQVGTAWDMPISVQWDDSGSVAWVLRHFKNVTFIDAANPTFNGPAIVLPRISPDPKAEKPRLGAAYVGTDYPVRYDFDRASIQYWDVLSWVYARDTRNRPEGTQRVALWVRGDVYGAAVTPAGDGK
jgi:uncharacterized protein (TIGR03663 family)